MKIIFSTITLVLSSLLFCQNTGTSEFGMKNGTLNINSTSIDHDNINEKHYLGKEAFAKVDNYPEQVEYKYNAYTDTFEFKEGAKRRALDKRIGQKVVFVDGRIFEFLNYKDLNNNLVSGYLQLLSNEISNKILLYKQTKLSETTSLNKNSYDGSAGTINYRSETNYYISDSNYIIPLPKSAKKIEAILKVDVQEIVKKNKLNLNKEEDLIKLIDLLNK
ncbi:hypothetical protein HXZ62_07875 [Empedobacter falsenii]|uniref:hypothetical protein n=1 Tax=Empedobacter falsenii TaxID=343874 RepID=UPI002577F6F3|nr:hypothetical protein [Empedobacter falsenii]MDM1062478.1 hypothetical protein [Empedobacter falsenii]MDM1547259.1 hypothetical protein [Empedobacter falsenii]